MEEKVLEEEEEAEEKEKMLMETTVRMKPVDRDGPSVEIFKEATNGKVVIGRGEFLRCADKKVSRVHAELQLETDGSFYLAPLHVNPCFFYSGGNMESRLEVRKGQRQKMENGDHFSLLPYSFVYAVVLEMNATNNNNNNNAFRQVEKTNEIAKRNGANKTAEEIETLVEAETFDNNVERMDDKFDVPSIVRKRSLPSWLLGVSSEKDANMASATKNKKTVKKNKTEEPSTSKENGDKTEKKATANKDISSSDADIEEELDKATSSKTVTDVKEKKEAAAHKGKRSNCRFGNNCYRKNSAHFEEFSHPGDSDYASEDEDEDDPDPENDNRPECEFGLNCYRKNPQHRSAYKHTTRPRPQRRAAKNAKKKTSMRDEGSDNSDSFEDSFIDDDSDEYKPSKDDADYSGDDEDLKALRKEAKEFMNSKKFR